MGYSCLACISSGVSLRVNKQKPIEHFNTRIDTHSWTLTHPYIYIYIHVNRSGLALVSQLGMDRAPPPKPRRARHRISAMHYESLPTAPPAMCGRADENIFQFPAVASRARNLSASPKLRDEKDLPACEHGKHSCHFCQPYRADRGTIEPLKNRLNTAIEAMDQLTRTCALLEGLLEQKLATITDNEEESATEMETDIAVSNAASTSMSTPTAAVVPVAAQAPATSTPTADTEFELEHSLTWLESLLGTEVLPPTKQGKFKRYVYTFRHSELGLN